MAMTKSDKELIEEKFKGLSDKMNIMIAKQEITNGRVNSLEDNNILNGEQHKAISDILIKIEKTFDGYKKKNIGFWLYFSEKPMRLITFASLLVGAVIALTQMGG